MPTKTRYIIKYWWNLVTPRSTSYDQKPFSGISNSQTWEFMFCKSKKEESVDLELTRGHLSKLLLEGQIFCENFNSLILDLFYLKDS